MFRRLVLLYFLLSCFRLDAQEFQHGWSHHDIASDRYFRLNYENDLVFGTDYYLTQGVHFEAVSPGIGKLPTRYLLLRPDSCYNRFGMALESAGYTPTVISADSIRYGDRPFAGLASLKVFSNTTNTSRGERYATTLTIGLLGPAAYGREIQETIHKKTGNADPVGWKYQVGNALILNYEVNYERAVFKRRRFLLSAAGLARIGTFSIKTGIGGVLIAGWFDNPFRPVRERRKLSAYVYAHPQFDFVGYDATLQGGLFTDNSPYTIRGEQIARLVYRFEGGVRVGYGGLLVSIYSHYLSNEFDTGLSHGLGGIQLAYAF
jgi:hypothetical protein